MQVQFCFGNPLNESRFHSNLLIEVDYDFMEKWQDADFLFEKNEGILPEPQVLRQTVIGILEFSAIEYFSGFSG